MFPFFTAESMNMDAVIASCKTMLKVAHVDGVHPAEIALIRQFYDSCVSSESGADWPVFDVLLQQSGEPFHVNAQAFSGIPEREMVVALGIMTGFADGVLSDAEQAAIKSIAADLEISSNRVDAINSAVKDHMLAQLSHLPDAGSVAKVARELS